MYTEEEAREKWCPRMTMPTHIGKQESHCIASGCGAWRWVPAIENSREKIEAIKQRRLDTNEGLHEAKRWVEQNMPNLQRTKGYCGLAGRPE